MTWLKRILILICALITVYVLFITFLVFSPTISDYFNRNDFDSQTWIEWKEAESSMKVRWNMTHDLTNNYNLIGKKASDLKMLLGKPSRENKNEISYYLGMTGHGINTGSITFKILEGIVIEYKIWQG
ncbi:hypothetical protein [Tamlana flava]|uniref:hypothetical protein n=1 Tax=Tamlana flava TaxID=3158572 RepID=UPI00351BCC9A